MLPFHALADPSKSWTRQPKKTASSPVRSRRKREKDCSRFHVSERASCRRDKGSSWNFVVTRESIPCSFDRSFELISAGSMVFKRGNLVVDRSADIGSADWRSWTKFDLLAVPLTCISLLPLSLVGAMFSNCSVHMSCALECVDGRICQQRFQCMESTTGFLSRNFS